MVLLFCHNLRHNKHIQIANSKGGQTMTLKEMRVAKGLTSIYIANQLAISHRQFSRIEAGEGYLTKERVKIMSRLYGVRISEIEEGAKRIEGID